MMIGLSFPCMPLPELITGCFTAGSDAVLRCRLPGLGDLPLLPLGRCPIVDVCLLLVGANWAIVRLAVCRRTWASHKPLRDQARLDIRTHIFDGFLDCSFFIRIVEKVSLSITESLCPGQEIYQLFSVNGLKSPLHARPKTSSTATSRSSAIRVKASNVSFDNKAYDS